VALTFDDGPYPLYTPLLLEVLRRHSVKATFFVTGQAVRQYPQLARQIAADGHELANHTFTHRRGSELSEAELAQEILDTEQALREVVGVVPSLFRPAGGNLSRAQQALVGRLGYTTVLYTVNPGDWWVRDPEEVSELTMSGRQEEGVILLHSGSMSTLRALPGVLARLRQRGLAPVTVGRLAQARGLTLPANPRELPALAAKPQPPGETLFQRFLQGLVASTRPPAEGRTPQAGRALPRAD
jgi:peptidoglycan/xylan/chitin deacetylase (PgdA/CDA1 family)